MYYTDQKQIAIAEDFIAKIPDSIVKGNYQRWLLEVKKDNRISYEELEKFVSLSGALPVGLQNFPQTFSALVKNAPNTDRREALEGTVHKAELNALTSKSISNVKDAPKEPVREGAKLQSDKEVGKAAKTVVVKK